ncbi:hypothetical protein EDD36DRAFT_424708 [Exophiala viscosa]|uniref:Uncharacterized protein n=1 Tax=Exophiala viscosa TaxID=2486360 RepID=A0AAN6IHD3_9EURO|nr:hypothetical protein EDD36DRAFT_424708 [Exophiala viscosa]
MPARANKPAATKHKRMHSDVPDGPSKRVNISEGDTPFILESDAEELVEHYSHERLKTLVVKLLGDPVAGPIVSRELGLNEPTDSFLAGIPDDVLQEVRSETKSECERIMREARDTASALASRAEGMGSKSTVTLGAWPRALEDHLPNIRALMERGAMVDGPALAWTAVLSVAKSAIHEWDRGMAKVEGDESDCDWFHEDVDDLMLDILVAQKAIERQQNVDPEWVDGGRYDEIVHLMVRAKGRDGPCMYRYPRTMRYIDEGVILPMVQNEIVWASKANRKSAPTGVKMAGEDDDNEEDEEDDDEEGEDEDEEDHADNYNRWLGLAVD